MHLEVASLRRRAWRFPGRPSSVKLVRDSFVISSILYRHACGFSIGHQTLTANPLVIFIKVFSEIRLVGVSVVAMVQKISFRQ